ncbi:MAG: hypothetical protein N7Q72_03395, partial [Spiroplasma sp. Tabriz.8]|nr:hypothetical protein [Spiroplasma sp. Tabriz.8]
VMPLNCLFYYLIHTISSLLGPLYKLTPLSLLFPTPLVHFSLSLSLSLSLSHFKSILSSWPPF